VPKVAVLSMALDAALLDRAEPSAGNPDRADPYGAHVIFNELGNILSVKLRELGEFSVLPTCEPFGGSNPKSPVARGEQAPNVV